MKFVLTELIVELETLRLKGNNLLGSVEANHSDGRQITDATECMAKAINSLQKIGFGI